jgi:6-pyruvoyltetrahydropterin/6-carboxytetrahydropterin synthase
MIAGITGWWLQNEATMQHMVMSLQKESMKFSAGHFTLFSATRRERMHGHNFSVGAVLEIACVQHDLAFDYGIYKRKLQAICDGLDEYFLLPGCSPWLRVVADGPMVFAHFNGERIPFLQRDVRVLQIGNITNEGLASWILQELRAEAQEAAELGVVAMAIKVFSGPGQSCEVRWKQGDEACELQS